MSLGFSARASPLRSPSQAPPLSRSSSRRSSSHPARTPPRGSDRPAGAPLPGKAPFRESGRRPTAPRGMTTRRRRHRHAAPGGLLGGARRRLSPPSPQRAHLSSGLFSFRPRASLLRAPAASILTPPRPASSQPAPSGEAQTRGACHGSERRREGAGPRAPGPCGLAEPRSFGQSSLCSGAPRGGGDPGRAH